MFRDRFEAGRLLAVSLMDLAGRADLLLLGIPRGGVVVAAEVARALNAPLDIWVSRKLGAPGNPELAIGAVAADGTFVLDRDLARSVGADEAYVVREADRQRTEIARRVAEYRQGRPPLAIQDTTAILVDDGIATGATIEVAIRALRAAGPREIILAVPVAAADSLARLRPLVDRVECLRAPAEFWAVGAFYAAFDQTTDLEVKRLLQEAAGRRPERPHPLPFPP